MTEIKFLWAMICWVPYWVKSRGVVHWDDEDGDSRMGYREMWHLRPRYMGHLKTWPCGCKGRFRHVVWYSSDCVLGNGPHRVTRAS